MKSTAFVSRAGKLRFAGRPADRPRRAMTVR